MENNIPESFREAPGAVNSDHCPLLIDTHPSDVNALRPFRFEAMWTKDPRCNGVISEA